MPKVVIIGAGLTGLSVAYHLEQNNFFDFEIYEKESRPGGLMRSEQSDGFTFDYTGHFLHVSNQDFYQFIDATMGIEHFDVVQRQAAIYAYNTFIQYPFQMNLYGLPSQVIYECLHEYIKKPRMKRTPKTFYEWVITYFGKGLGKHFFFPYNEKLLAFPLKKIHHAWTGRFVPKTSLQEILIGALEKRSEQQKVGYNSSFYYPKKGGIEFCIKQLTNKISCPINTQHECVALDQEKKMIKFANGASTSYKTLVTTAPLDYTLKSMQHSSRSTLKQAIPHLWCNTVVNFNIGFSKPQTYPYHWVYFPEHASPFYRLGFWHNISESLVTPKNSGIYGELSYQPRKKTRTEIKKTIDRAIEHTLRFLELTQQDVATIKTLELSHGYVIYDNWREKNITKIQQALEDYDIYSCGRFGAWKYSSMQEAFVDGKEIALRILNFT